MVRDLKFPIQLHRGHGNTDNNGVKELIGAAKIHTRGRCPRSSQCTEPSRDVYGGLWVDY